VRLELQEVYSAIEEAKADIVGLWALHFLLDKVLNNSSCVYFGVYSCTKYPACTC
jgi:hypothetical protein